jgi:hypothetical protein
MRLLVVGGLVDGVGVLHLSNSALGLPRGPLLGCQLIRSCCEGGLRACKFFC